jgi:hypothetical protein
MDELLVRRERTVEPDPGLRDIYDEGFARYLAAIAALTGTLHELARQAEGTAPTIGGARS